MRVRPTCLFIALLAVATTGLWAGEGDGDEVVRKEVRKVVIDCDGEDCSDDHRVIALDGGNAVWISDEDCEGEECDFGFVRKIAEDVECDGEECDRQVFVFKTGGGPMAFGEHDFKFEFGPRGFLGVQFLPLTQELAEHFEVGSGSGVMVSKVIEDSPAERAGLQVGDIITSVNGEGLGRGGLVAALSGTEGGDEVDLGVVRFGREMAINATLDEREGHAMAMGHGGPHKVIEIHGAPGAPHAIGHRHLDHDDLCEGLEECEIRIECEEEDNCSCEVNGEAVDCPSMN